MKSFLLVTLCVVVCSAVPSFIEEWISFKTKHGKQYKSQNEENLRMGIYLKNKEIIENHNTKYKLGLVSYEMKINHFGDQLQEEITEKMNRLNGSGHMLNRKPGKHFLHNGNIQAPLSIDWRQKGAVTPVKDQGSCGACWAFSSTGALEGQIFKKTGKLISLSEQNLVDCSNDFGNNGCNGGLMDQAFEYIRENQGIDSEESYPYEGIDGECRFKQTNVAGSLRNYVDIPQGDEEALKNAVATIGPISVAINAGLQSFSFYGRGVYNEDSCDPRVLNHGVLLVGYGTEDDKDYWLIKNSWSTTWGEDGYVKIARNQGNLCGVASMASYPVV